MAWLCRPELHWRTSEDPPSPTDSVLAAPFAGHLTMNGHMRAERREALVERYTPNVIRPKHKTAQVKGVKFDHRDHKRRLRGESPARAAHGSASAADRELRQRPARRRRARAAQAAAAGRRFARTSRPSRPASPAATTRRTPATGSTASTSSRSPRGRRSAAPATRPPASEAEQDSRAAMLYAQAGASPWPVCGA